MILSTGHAHLWAQPLIRALRWCTGRTTGRCRPVLAAKADCASWRSSWRSSLRARPSPRPSKDGLRVRWPRRPSWRSPRAPRRMALLAWPLDEEVLGTVDHQRVHACHAPGDEPALGVTRERVPTRLAVLDVGRALVPHLLDEPAVLLLHHIGPPVGRAAGVPVEALLLPRQRGPLVIERCLQLRQFEVQCDLVILEVKRGGALGMGLRSRTLFAQAAATPHGGSAPAAECRSRIVTNRQIIST